MINRDLAATAGSRYITPDSCAILTAVLLLKGAEQAELIAASCTCMCLTHDDFCEVERAWPKGVFWWRDGRVKTTSIVLQEQDIEDAEALTELLKEITKPAVDTDGPTPVSCC